MKISFLQPPAAQSAGGITAALGPLEAALRELGHTISPDLAADTDVAHFHGLWQFPHHALARHCRQRGIPYLVSPHGMLEPWAFRSKRWKKLPFFHVLEKPYLRSAAALLTTSRIESDNLSKRVAHQRIVALPLGLTGPARPDYESSRRALGWDPREKVLLYLSRIDRKKGLDILLEALVDAAVSGVRLVIVGGGASDYVRNCQRIARERADRLPPVDWAGEIWGEARWPYLQGADLFCLPTHSENFGLAVLEALQVGTPVLTTRLTPWPDLMNGREGAFFCQPERTSVKEALTAFGESKTWTETQRAELANWAHDEFNWCALGIRYGALYREVAVCG